MITAMKYLALIIIFTTMNTFGATNEARLVWSDEFDYKRLPDKTKWGYEEGFVRNNEKQYYTKERLENARVEDGMLVIEGRKEKYEYSSKDGLKSAGYTSASLNTLNKIDWQYGRIEVRAKLPQGKGVWPAIWMMGTNVMKVGWPKCGEIDVMEFVGHTTNKVYATVHYPQGGQLARTGGVYDVEMPYADFHVYAVEWRPDRMDFFFDTDKYFTFDISKADNGGDNPFRKPFYLLINLALGGEWGGEIDDKIMPQKYLIDYVRVYTFEQPK